MYVARREHDPQSARVAVKLLRGELARDADFRERFRREVSAAMRVESRHTARVLAADIDAPQPWLATELVPGSTLHEVVATHGPLSHDQQLHLGNGLALALAAVHRKRLTHRDIKPSNIILTGQGPRVIDFGVAGLRDVPSVTSTGVVVDRPAGSAPSRSAAARSRRRPTSSTGPASSCTRRQGQAPSGAAARTRSSTGCCTKRRTWGPRPRWHPLSSRWFAQLWPSLRPTARRPPRSWTACWAAPALVPSERNWCRRRQPRLCSGSQQLPRSPGQRQRQRRRTLPPGVTGGGRRWWWG